jgi:hypothetical protein
MQKRVIRAARSIHNPTPFEALTRGDLHLHSVGLWVPAHAFTEALALRLQDARAYRRTPRRKQEWVAGWLFVAHHCGPRHLAQLQAILDEFPAVSLSRVDIATDLHFADNQGRWNANRFLRRHLFIRRGATELVQRIHWLDERGERNGNWTSCDFTEDGPRAHLQKPKTRRTLEGYQDPKDKHGKLIGESVLRLELRISRQAGRSWPFSAVSLDQVMTLDPATVLDRLLTVKFIDPAKALDAFAKPKRRRKSGHGYRLPTGILDRALEYWPCRVTSYTMNQPFALPITPSWARFRSEFSAC